MSYNSEVRAEIERAKVVFGPASKSGYVRVEKSNKPWPTRGDVFTFKSARGISRLAPVGHVLVLPDMPPPATDLEKVYEAARAVIAKYDVTGDMVLGTSLMVLSAFANELKAKIDG